MWLWHHVHILEANLKKLNFQVCAQTSELHMKAWRNITQKLMMSHVQNSRQHGNLNLTSTSKTDQAQYYWEVRQYKIEDEQDVSWRFWLLTLLANIWGPRTLQQKLQKSSYRPYTLQLFFTTATIFLTVLYMDKDFYNDFFRKLFVKIFVMCEGLYSVLSDTPIIQLSHL